MAGESGGSLSSRRSTAEKFRTLAILCASMTAAIALAMLVAWAAGTERLAAARMDRFIEAPGTAFALLFLGGALVLLSVNSSSRASRIFAVMAGMLAALFSTLVLIQYLAGVSGGINVLLPASATEINGLPANSTSPVTAAGLLASAVALVLLAAWRYNRKSTLVATVLAMLAGLNALTVGFAYLFGVPLLHNDKIIPMSLETSISSILFSLALLAAAGPDFWPMSLFVGNTLRARLMRVFLPLTVFIVIVEGVVIHQVHHDLTPLNPALVSSLMALIFVIISGLLVMRLVQMVGGSIDRADTERRLMEMDLRRSEERLRLLFENSPVSIWEEDFSQVKEYVDNLKLRGVEDLRAFMAGNPEEVARCVSMVKILSVNDATLRMFEAEDMEQLLSGLGSLFTDESMATFRDSLIAVFEGNTNFQLETGTRTLKGRRLDIMAEWTVLPGFEDDLSRIIVSILDISDLKQKEKDLKVKTRQLEASQRVASLGSWEWDIVNDSITWSDELYRIFGLEPQSFEATYEAFLAMVHPDDRGELDAAVSQALSECSDYHVTARILRSDGSEWVMEALGEVTCDDEGKPLRMGGTAQDVTERNRMEMDLRNSEQRFRDLFEGAPDAIFLADPDTGMIVGANMAAAELVGRPVADLINMHQSELHPGDMDEESRMVFERHISEALERGKVTPIEYEVVRADGERVPVEIIAQMIYHEGKPVFLGTFRDITERKVIERALRDSEEKYRALYDAASDAIFVLKMTASGPMFVDCNSRTLEMFACEREDVIGRSPLDFSPERQPDGSTSEEAIMNIAEAAMSGESQRAEWIHCRKDGSCFDAEVTVNAVEIAGERYMQAIVRDVTERKRADEAIGISEEKYRELFEQATDGIFVVTMDTAEIVDVNTVAMERLGYSREEMIGMKVSDINPPEEPPAIRERFERQRAGETITFETEHRRKDGSWMPVEITSKMITQGDSSFLQAIVRDITDRKQAEAELRASEEKFRTIVTNSQPIIFMLDRNGVFQLCEGKSLEVLGLEPGQAVGMSAFEMYADFPDVTDGIRSALEGRASRGVIDVNGASLDVFFSPYGSDDGGVAGVMGMAIDITEREEAKREVERSEHYYDSIFSSIKDGISILDMDMHIQTVNNTMKEWFSFRQPLEGKLCYEVYHGRDEPCDTCPVLQTIESGKPAYEVVPKRDEDGEISGWFDLYSFPLFDDETGELRGIIEYVRDISQQQQALEDLKLSEDNYRRLFEESPMALVIHRGGVLIKANQAAVDLVGADSPEGVIGSNVFDFVHPDYREMAVERMKNIFREGGQAPTVEEKFIRRDGSIVDVEVSAIMVKYQGKDAIQVAIQDVTERKLLEEQLRQAQKMESVGTMAGGIAHDFNNFLTAIEGYIDLSLMDLPEDSPVREELLEARRSADRAANLTRQLLLFSRREPMNLKPSDLSRIIADMHSMLDRLLGERYTLETNLRSSIWTIKADMGHMEQVIMNLVVNARDAMPDGGTIRISTENVVVDEDYASENTEAAAGNYICMEVADTGTGMAKHTLSHIFDPFFSTKSGGEGTGLGLSVVYGIISQHGGWIDVDSAPGRGSVFRVFIPAMRLEQKHVGEKQELVEDLEGHGERVLLVEDEDAVRALANRLLSEHGYQVYAASDVEEADRIFEREKGEFDLVFSDVVLPGEDGISFVGRLRKQKPGLRVLLASGYSGDETNRLEIERQGFHFMQKPYSLKELMVVVNKMLTER